MVKVTGPCYSLTARGWLGKDTYARTGVVPNPYPIALLNPNLMSGFYYSHTGWCYQRRRTWHGIIWSAMRAYMPTNPQTVPQQAWRAKFAGAVSAWQGLTGLQKGIWNSYNYPKHPTGYTRFIRAYLLDKPH